jgi:hypothetical protein
MRCRLELTQLCWAGKNLRRVGPILIETEQIVAQAETAHYSVLYLRCGNKVLVREGLGEINRLQHLTDTARTVLKRFKRDIRECKTMGMSIDQSFAALWEEIATEVELPEQELRQLYNELLDWTKRWLK